MKKRKSVFVVLVFAMLGVAFTAYAATTIFDDIDVEGGDANIGKHQTTNGVIRLYGTTGVYWKAQNTGSNMEISTASSGTQSLTVKNTGSTGAPRANLVVQSGDVRIQSGSFATENGAYTGFNDVILKSTEESEVIAAYDGSASLNSAAASSVAADFNGDAYLHSDSGAEVIAETNGDVVIQLGS